jgi:transcriptional regulator with XRE-family HTH domain
MEIMLVVFGNEAVNISGELVDEVRSFVDDHYVKEALSEEYRRDRLYLEECQVCASVFKSVEAEPTVSLDDALKSIYTESFEKYLQKLINKKGLKNSQVYATANISKQYFSKLLKGKVKPSKEKVLALAIGLNLNLDEAVDFLRIAGYALSPISQTDTIVEYFIRNKDYNVLKIDIVLFDYGLEPLSNA